MALRGVALGMTVQTTFATALGAVPRDKVARGSSLINGTRFVIQSIGVAILATVLSSTLSTQTKTLQEQARPQIASSAPTRFGICETPGVVAERNVPPGVPDVAVPQVRAGIQQACTEYVTGFENTYQVTFYVAFIALILGAFMPGWPFKWAGRGAAASETPTLAH